MSISRQDTVNIGRKAALQNPGLYSRQKPGIISQAMLAFGKMNSAGSWPEIYRHWRSFTAGGLIPLASGPCETGTLRDGKWWVKGVPNSVLAALRDINLYQPVYIGTKGQRPEEYSLC